MHLQCPHCRNGIELVPPAAEQEVVCPSCGSSFQVDPNATKPYSKAGQPRQLGRYVLLDQVGLGAFGAVWKARDTELDRVVALKVPRAGNLPSGRELDRFFREARSVGQLRHPGIVSVHDVGQAEETPFIVSDFVAGVTLADLLSARRPSFRDAADLIAKLADALHYAHQMGVVHRDVKPANVLMEGADTATPKLADFGLAKRDAGEITMTLDGQVLGTPAYMSPEQARGEGHQVDGRGDLYSLGVMLYELLTGELPFRGTTRMLLHQVLKDEPKAPRSLNDRIPRDLETVCLKAMAKEPARRYATAGEFAADLRRFLKGEPVQARPLGRIERTVRWCRRNPVGAALAASLVLGFAAAASLAGWAWVERGRADQKTADAVEEKKRADGKAEEALAEKRRADAKAEEALEALDRMSIQEGLRLADEGDPAAALPWFARPLAATPRVTAERARMLLLRLENYLQHSCPRLRPPDGSSLAFESRSVTSDGRWRLRTENDTCLVLDVITGLSRTPALRHGGNIRDAAFSPDGRTVATGGWDKTARVWDSATGQPRTPELRHGEYVRHVAFSPDGRALVSSGEDNTACVWEVATGSLRAPPLRHPNAVLYAAYSPDGRAVVTLDLFQATRVWDAASVMPRTPPPQFAAEVGHAAFSPDGIAIVTANGDTTARLWDAASGQPLTPQLPHEGIVRHAAFSHDGKAVVTASSDKTARLWDAATGKLLAPPLRHDGDVNHAAFSPDGRAVVTSCDDGTARLWDAVTGQPRAMPLRHKRRVVHAGFSPDGRSVVTSSTDATAQVWSAATGEALAPPLRHEAFVFHAAFSPNGKAIVTSGFDGTARVWNSATGQSLTPPLRHEVGVLMAAFSPDGRAIVTAGIDKSARVWDAATGQPRTPPLHHADQVRCAAFSPDGRVVATAGEDQSARLWDAATGQALSPPLRQRGKIWHVAFSPDGKSILSAGEDAARVWAVEPSPLAPSDAVDLAALYAGFRLDSVGGRRQLTQEEFQRLHARLAAKHPELFVVTPMQARLWREEQIRACWKDGDWPALRFHLGWLLAEAVAKPPAP